MDAGRGLVLTLVAAALAGTSPYRAPLYAAAPEAEKPAAARPDVPAEPESGHEKRDEKTGQTLPSPDLSVVRDREGPDGRVVRLGDMGLPRVVGDRPVPASRMIGAMATARTAPILPPALPPALRPHAPPLRRAA